MTDEPQDMDLPPLNEWIVDELTRTQDSLRDLMRRHEEIVNHLADVCKRNDRMREAGDALVSLLLNVDYKNTWVLEEDPEAFTQYSTLIEEAIQKWGEANT